MSAEEITEEEFEFAMDVLELCNDPYEKPLAEVVRAYLAQQIAAAEIRGVREGWEAKKTSTDRFGEAVWGVDDYLKERKS